MASLLRRTTILTFSRTANQAIVILSPLVLVRVLSVVEYGSYREFILYAALIGTVVKLGIPHSLAFFVPRYPEHEKTWVTQTALLTLAFTSVAIIGVALAGDVLRANTSFDFVSILQLYILFAFNLDFLEHYWLGKKRTDKVLYYSLARLTTRVGVTVWLAIVTGDAYSIIAGLVVLESIRCLLVLLYAIYERWFTRTISRETLKLQSSYAFPLGGGGLVEVLNSRAAMLFISLTLGPKTLAFYAIGTFAIQIVNVLRGAIADVIFPEIVEMKHAEPRDALPLWRRATVWYCILLFPWGILLFLYSEEFVTVLFTAEYLPAVPVFAAYAISLFLLCFDFHLPLRVQNANRFYVVGTIIGLITNLVLLYPLFLVAGLLGPAVAFLVSRFAINLYLAVSMKKLYEIDIPQLAAWREIGTVFIVALCCAPLLILGSLVVDGPIVRLVVFGGGYLVVYLLALRHLRIWDVVATFRALIAGSRRSGKVQDL